MFGGSDEEESNGQERESAEGQTNTRTERYNEMLEEVEEAAARRIQKAREPFRFDVFRNDDDEVTMWTLLADKRVDDEESRVPLAVGLGSAGEPEAMWFEYGSRFQQDRSEDVFEYSQKEQVVPSNAFYAWVSHAVESVAMFHRELDKLDNEDAFQDPTPDLPPLYANLNEYEREALDFFGDVILNHRDYTDAQADLMYEAVQRYPVSRDVRTAEEEQGSEDTDLPGVNEEGTPEP